MDKADQIIQIEETIRNLENLKTQGLLPPDQADASIAALKEKLATFTAKLEGDGAIAQGSGAKAVGAGGVLVEGDFRGSIYLGEDPEEDEKRLDIYRRWVVSNTSSLPLRGVDVGASDPTRAGETIGLANVYVDLDTKTQEQELLDKHETRMQEGRIVSGWEKDKTISVLEAVRDNRMLILLGDPGGGKSTFVNFLAHCLARHALGPKAGWLEHLNGWPKDEANLLPLPVILRDFARHYAEKLPNKAEPRHLWDFILSRLKAQNLDFAADPIRKKLDEGRVIVLLDGLDEVPTQAQRLFVRNAAQAFIERHPHSRYLVTCRVLSYQPPAKGKPDLRLADLPSFEIAPFDDEKIDHFVEAWYAELARLGTIKSEDQKGLTARLAEAVARPDLKQLAPNPLLLTVMALVHTHKGRLPDARALLYEETIDILLWRWEQIKLGGQEDTPRLRQYLLEARLMDVDLKRALWELAFQAHATSKSADGEGLADIPEHRILKTLAELKCDDEHPNGDLNWAQRVVDLMKIRAGLLLERQPEVFTLPHRTFQEYLAGAHLAAQTDFATKTAHLAKKDNLQWREAALYAAGKLVYINADVGKALSLVAELCLDDIEDSEDSWRLAWLAGDLMAEIGLKRTRDSALGRDLLKRVQYRLKDLLVGGKLAPRERANAGDTLAALGDPRREVLDVDAIQMCHVPAGKFWMGSPQGEGDSEERPQHEIDLPEFWISRYPVTNAQFKAFVKAGGYAQKKFWTEAEQEGFWGSDKFKGILDSEPRTKPMDLGEPFNLSNHPVVGVSWYEALAFARWLDEQAKDKDFLKIWKSGETMKIHKSYHVSLPSEAEWEKAARGSDKRIYPWGNQFDPDCTNNRDTGVGTTSAVGCFPKCKNPYDLQDMSGNIWEWTSSIFKDYPYQPNDGRDDLHSTGDHVLRGGSFYNSSSKIRCASRGRGSTSNWSNGFGFRVVVSLQRAAEHPIEH